MSKFQWTLLWLFCALVATWLVVPTLIVVPMSFNERQSLAFPPAGFSWRWYENFFTNVTWRGSLVNSLQIACIVAVIATAVGTAAALGVEKLKHRGGNLVRALLMAPIIVPTIVLATGIYAVYLDQRLVGTYAGYVLAHTMLAVPYVLVAVGANLSVFDARLETAAASLGANRATTFLTVTLPLILPGILSGMLFAFVTSFDEVLVALFITSPHLKTLPVQIFASMTRDSDPTVAAVGTMILVVTTLIIAAGLLVGPIKKRKTS